MKRGSILVVLPLLVVALTAWQCTVQIGAPQATATPVPTDTPSPPTLTPTPPPPTPTPTPAAVVALEEDFSDNHNGWYEYGPDELGTYVLVQDGAYDFLVVFETGGVFYWGTGPTQEFSDFDLRAEASLLSESANDNEVAVIFGYQDNDNFYEFAYSRDGFVMLAQTVNGEFEFLREWSPSDAVAQGDVSNDLRLVMESGFLTAYIHGEEVLTSDVPDYAGGLIGFGCGVFEEPQSHCTFDNLTVLISEEAGPPPAEVVLEEDFSDNRNEWFEYGPDGEENAVFVDNGVYNFHVVHEPGLEFWWGATTAWDLVDFALEAEATYVSGTENYEIAVVFGVTDDLDFYRVSYFSDGGVVLSRDVNGVNETIQEESVAEILIPGTATNQVGLWIQDGVLTVFINDEQVMEVEVPGYTGGWIGFGCGALDPPDAFCTFDDLVVADLG